MALGASVATSQAAERATPYSLITGSFDALMVQIMAPAGEPISTPTPRAKPKRIEPASASVAAKPDIVAQCGYASIIANAAKDGETPVFYASFADGMIDEMVLGGCAQFYQGCNICSVRYEGCSEAAKAACTDAACLEKTCERKVKCTAKFCTVQGGTPTCKARIARTQCRRPMFN